MPVIEIDQVKGTMVQLDHVGVDYSETSSDLEGHAAGIDDKLDFDSIDVDLIPTTDNNVDLGSAAKQWAEVRGVTLYGDGSHITGVGVSAATALTISAKVNEAAGLIIGEVVYISGATGQFPQVSLADNTDSTKEHYAGIAAETKADGQTILIRVEGELTGFDTDQGGTWADGDPLYLSTAGAMVTTAPTVGAVHHLGHVSYAHAVTGKMVITHHNSENSLTCAAAEDITIRMGDAAGGNKVSFRDYGDNEVVAMDSDGITTPTTNNTGGIGSATHKFADVWATTVHSGDVAMANGWRISEVLDDEGKIVPGHEPEAGVIFANSNKEEIFKITNDGLWFKGRKIA